MKGESGPYRTRRDTFSQQDAETVALRVLAALAGDSERLARFLALTGLDPGTIREAAADPGFLSCVMDYVASDESLLVALAGEAGLTPHEMAAVHARLSPGTEWSP